MVDSPPPEDLTLATLAGVAAVSGSYAVAGYTPAFVAAPIDALVVALTPGSLVTFVIETVGDEGHLLHVGLSLLLAVGTFAASSLAGLAFAERAGSQAAGAGVGGALAWVFAVAITREPVLAAGAALPVAVVTVAGPGRGASEPDRSRRRTLAAVAGTFGFVGAAVGVRRLASADEQIERAPGTADVDQQLQAAEDRSLDVANDSLPGLVSSIDEFYNVDIAEFDPTLSAEDWSLTITGELAGEARTITYDDLQELPVEHRFVTLRCVGEQLNGRKLDTALWTGTPIEPLLRDVDPDGDCSCAMLRGEDGYFVQFPTEVLADGFLAWGMNGKRLPEAHGYPVRILIPGHWGETNVKWLTEIEVLDEEMDGYWEQRGWAGTGPVNTVAKLWDEGVTMLEDGRIELAGHAYAGTRGIERVDVSTDGGETWTAAELSAPLRGDAVEQRSKSGQTRSGNDVWRQWRHAFEPAGAHDVVVRAVDGTGAVQPREESDPSPSGASGWVRRTVEA